MNQKRTVAILLGGFLVLSAGAVTAATASGRGGTHPTASPHRSISVTPAAHRQVLMPGQSRVAMAASTSPTSAASPVTTVAPSPPVTTTTPAATAALSAAAVPSGTVDLSVVPNSGVGCSAGITDGAQWIKYTVHPGDTLSMIAQCFSLNGYQTLYQDNQGVLGANPNLIFPGQVITIVNGKMSVGSK